ncbi:MAG: tautomerase family protein [Actinobacteria bacterium]|nr:tautomerase family protein [Actinomycetota bacterium]
MPTYTCWSEPGVVSPEVRAQIAKALTEIHHEVAVAPRYFVQVIFVELQPGSIFIAGEAAPAAHLWVRADIRAGRTAAQKHELLGRITTELGQLTGTGPENVWVYINDIPGANIAEYGRDLPDPGQEDAWFAALPPELQQSLRPLA